MFFKNYFEKPFSSKCNIFYTLHVPFVNFFKKLADLHTSEICGFLIADCAQEFADL
jgi:hypothetical protein